MSDQTDPIPTYRSLNSGRQEIRLLNVQPGTGEKPLHCTLEYTFLTEPVTESYETISYVWGDEKLRGLIILNGSIFDIPASAEEVLRRVRFGHIARKVWIDAVCINQKDVRERESQVAIMSEIYGKTRRNLIWLGQDHDDTNERATVSIAAILKDAQLETDDFRLYVSKMYSQDQRFHFSATGISQRVDWDAFGRYMEAVWFTRLWVIQEAALAPESICLRGQSELLLTDVLRAACWTFHKNVFLSDGPKRSRGLVCAVVIAMYADKDYGAYNFFHNQEGTAVALSSLLDEMKNFDARDERDYIYGLLGLYKRYFGSDTLPDCLVPNYTTSYTVLFREVARMTILEHAELAILENLNHRPLSEYIPSWVPLYHVKYDVEVDRVEIGEGSFRACGSLNLDLSAVRSPQNRNMLTLKGFRISRISQTSCTFSQDSFLKRDVTAYMEVLDEAEKIVNEASQLSGDQKLSAISRTLCYGSNARGEWLQHSESLDLYKSFSEYIRRNRRLPDLSQELSEAEYLEAEKASVYTQALYNACIGRRVFITYNGQIGLAPSSVKLDDLVVILFGGRVPFVLRPKVDRTSEYELIGHCFMLDTMHGEVADAWIESGQEPEIFNLV